MSFESGHEVCRPRAAAPPECAAAPAPQVVLYGPRGLPLTEKVGRALRIKGLPFSVVEPDAPEDYARLSPETGLLPVLETEGARIPDSTAILDFLDERFPEPPLVSPDRRAAREQRRLERWMDQTFAFYMLRWVRNRVGAAAAPSLIDGNGFPIGGMSRLGLIGAGGRLRPDLFDTGPEGPGPEFEHRLDDLVRLLGRRSFFFAERISRADLSVYAALSLMDRGLYAGARALLERRPRLLAHLERVADVTGGAEPV